MKEINLPSGNYMFVKVPNDAYNFRIYIEGTLFCDTPNIKAIILTNFKNSISIISTTNDITEKQCESIVKDCDIYAKCWKEYTYQSNNEKDVRFNSMYSCRTAKKSLQSLIKSVGLDVKNNYLILKKLS